MKHKNLFFIFLFCPLLLHQSLFAQVKIEIADKNALARINFEYDSIPDDDMKMASTLYNALSTSNKDSIKWAEKYYFEKSHKDTLSKIKIFNSLSWLCQCITASKKTLKKKIADPLNEDLFNYFTENNYKRLLEYLKIKYHLENSISNNNIESSRIISYYDDLLMFNDPNRETWDSTSKIMAFLPLKKGDKVVDLGCGFGYYTYKLSKKVGKEGKVYATEINKKQVDYMHGVVEKHRIKNVVPLLTSPVDIAIGDSVDAIFISSLYHHLYLTLLDDERASLFKSFKHALKTNGYLIIVDNLYYNGLELNGWFIDRRLIVAQLAYWGFQFADYKEVSKQRFVLILKNTDEKVKEQTLSANEKNRENTFVINVSSEKPLFNFYWSKIESHALKGKLAAKTAFQFFEKGNKENAFKAIGLYDEIIEAEYLAKEYVAVRWLCEVQGSSDSERALILKNDSSSNMFYTTMTKNNNFFIKCFLTQKYQLNSKPDSLLENTCGKIYSHFLEDYVLNFKPRGINTVKYDFFAENILGLKKNMLTDSGKAPQYHIYRLSQLKENENSVFAVNFDERLSLSINKFAEEFDVNKVDAIKWDAYSFSNKGKADVIIMYSFYPELYGIFSENDRTVFLKTIKENLKPGGKLVVSDIGTVGADAAFLHKAFIPKELIAYQLAFYGFELENEVALNSQRFMLTFKLKDK